MTLSEKWEVCAPCTPGYYNREVQVSARLNQDSYFFGGPTEYADILESWREAENLDGLTVTVRGRR